MVTVLGFVAITGGGILCCGISRITQLIEVTRLVQIFVRSLDICDKQRHSWTRPEWLNSPQSLATIYSRVKLSLPIKGRIYLDGKFDNFVWRFYLKTEANWVNVFISQFWLMMTGQRGCQAAHPLWPRDGFNRSRENSRRRQPQNILHRVW